MSENIIHIIKTLLTSILELFQLHKNDEDASVTTQLIYNKSELLHLHNFHETLLHLELQDYSILFFLIDLLKEFKPICRLNQIGLKLNCGIQPDTKVLIDGTKLYTIISNLLTNAIKHAYKGTEIKLSASIDTDQVLTIVVVNKGKGIPEDELHRIFDRFYQATSNDQADGFGIGLSFSKELAKFMGGDIFVKSTLKKETSFTFKTTVQMPHCT